jgi:histidinol-phosphate/aromatic aminotransferase/cobyric acid decarboxylase-like protein
VSERDVLEVRARIDAERTRLDEDLKALQGEFRSAAPFVVVGIVAAAALGVALVLVLRRGKPKPRSVTITWKFT